MNGELTSDLSGLLERASASRDDWSLEKARQLVAELVGSAEGLRIEWDKPAGERWARILGGAAVVALVSSELPFLVIVGQRGKSLLAHSDTKGLELLEVESLNSRVFRAEATALREAFPVLRLAPESLSRKQFSIEDLWWATV
jgi:hypothetical protein